MSAPDDELHDAWWADRGRDARAESASAPSSSCYHGAAPPYVRRKPDFVAIDGSVYHCTATICPTCGVRLERAVVVARAKRKVSP